jgi:bacillithiol biosynthesis deacetylase BshB1
MTKVDVLAIAAHPDDVEVSCGGLLIRMADLGYNTGVLDLTRGEMGSRGTVEIRAAEAEAASRIMGLSIRRNARLPDSRLTLNEHARETVAECIRQLRPEMVILPCAGQRHPDHNAASEIGYAAIFAAGLKMFPVDGEPHRPQRILYATSFQSHRATFYVDISDQMERKLKAIDAYPSQFGDSGLPVSGKTSARAEIQNRARYYGSLCGVEYAEAYWIKESMRLENPLTELRLNSI